MVVANQHPSRRCHHCAVVALARSAHVKLVRTQQNSRSVKKGGAESTPVAGLAEGDDEGAEARARRGGADGFMTVEDF